jgi:predicted PurR-regulated permease PerM
MRFQFKPGSFRHEKDQMAEQELQPENGSPPWSRSTKIIVTVVALLLAATIALRFSALIALLTMAVILAYILNPLIVFANKRTHLSRGLVILFIYLTIAIGVVWSFVALGLAAVEQANSLINQAPQLIQQIVEFVQSVTTRTEPIFIGPFQIDPVQLPWNDITNQLLGLVEPAVSASGQFVRRLATSTVRTLGSLFFVFIISIYLANELPQLSSYIGRFATQPGYRADAERLMREFGRIWNAYLRGQVILGLVIFVVVWLGLAALGVNNSLALGLLSGVLEFIPNLGPIIGAGAAMIVAFFQPENYMGLPGWQFALVVMLFMIVVQQLENNLLVPRIVGGALDLHPLLVIIAVFIGGSLAGILGAVMAAPVLATLKLLGVYTWRKMFDLPPFPDPEDKDPPDATPLRERVLGYIARIRGSKKQNTSDPETDEQAA